jgi:hypothetical protein
MITGAVEITIEASTVGHLESFLTMCKLAGVPADTPIQARTAARRQLRQLGVKADSVAAIAGALLAGGDEAGDPFHTVVESQVSGGEAAESD